MLTIFKELKRRSVFKVAAAYIIVAWLLMQVSDVLAPALYLPGWFQSGVAFLLIIGFPVALIFAWAFELTPEGLKSDSTAGSGTAKPGHTLNRTIVFALFLALGWFAWDKFGTEQSTKEPLPAQDNMETEARTVAAVEEPTPAQQKSIVVLPFVNMSSDPEQEYFADGISEELLNLLAQIPNLRVISRTSAFSFKGKDIDIPTIAEQLGVSHVLEGSVRKAGSTIRITAQLIETATDAHLWSKAYDRPLDDVFAIQDEISAAIIESLRYTINLEAGESPRATLVVNEEAHDAYLRGKYLLAQREVEGAVREFTKAISLDPNYALAHAQLAIAYQLGHLDLTTTEMEASAAPHAEKAMQLDPSMAEAHAAAGTLSWSREESQEALRHFEKAIRINPNYADVYTWMAQILDWSLGRYSEAFAMREEAVKLDPLSIPALVNYASALINRGRLSEADRELEKLASLAPGYFALLRAERLSLAGNWADGALDLLVAKQTIPWDGFDGRLAFYFALMGFEEEVFAIEEHADSALLRLLGRSRQAVAAAQGELARDPVSDANRSAIGLSLASAGNYDDARPYLEEAWQKRSRVIMGYHFGVDHAVALIALRRAAGEEDQIADLVAAIRDNAHRYEEAGIATMVLSPSPDYENGLASLIAGDEKQGLALIARAVEDGYFIPPNQAYLQDLYEHPDYAAIRAIQESRQAREREKFLTVVCADNPYAEVWQPAEGTCEQFTEKEGN